MPESILTADDLREINDLLNNCKNLDKELKEMDRCTNFLINEYKTNKSWFKTSGSGKVTIEDVIKACFEFGWSSRKQFDYDNKK